MSIFFDSYLCDNNLAFLGITLFQSKPFNQTDKSQTYAFLFFPDLTNKQLSDTFWLFKSKTKHDLQFYSSEGGKHIVS